MVPKVGMKIRRALWPNDKYVTVIEINYDQDIITVANTDGTIEGYHRVYSLNQWRSWEEESCCSSCGTLQSDETFNSLTDITVTTAAGEEGYAVVRQLLCTDCLEPMVTCLKGLGFKDHRHGGINFLEDDECPHKYGDPCEERDTTQFDEHGFVLVRYKGN